MVGVKSFTPNEGSAADLVANMFNEHLPGEQIGDGWDYPSLDFKVAPILEKLEKFSGPIGDMFKIDTRGAYFSQDSMEEGLTRSILTRNLRDQFQKWVETHPQLDTFDDGITYVAYLYRVFPAHAREKCRSFRQLPSASKDKDPT